MIKLEALPSNIMFKIPKAKQLLLQETSVIFAYLFGGLASGKVTPLSDVDIAVYISIESEFDVYHLELFDKLAGALGTSELDLVFLNTAPLSLAGRILQNKQVLVDKDPLQRYDYESLTLRKFFDFRFKEEEYFQRRYGRG